MSARSRILGVAAILTVGVTALILGLLHFGSSREPSYQGKTLSEWIIPFCRQTRKGLEAPRGPEHFEELEPVRHAVAAMGANAVPALLPVLNDPNPITRQTVIRTLGEIEARPDLVIPALTNLLNERDMSTQMAVVTALRKFGYSAQPQPRVPEQFGGPGRPPIPGQTNPFPPR